MYFFKNIHSFTVYVYKNHLTGEEDLIAKVYAGNKFNMYSSIFGDKLTFQQVSKRI